MKGGAAASLLLCATVLVSVHGEKDAVAISRVNRYLSPVQRRDLGRTSSDREEDELLCGNQTLVVEGARAGFCPTLGQGGIQSATWGACCVFEKKRQNQCRIYEVDQPFCDEQGGQDCTTLSATDVLEFDLSFSALDASEECCKTCSCFGDPECVNFQGIANLWIPCDARSEKSCRMTKDKCSTMVDSNGNECAWRGGKKENSVGWNILLKGSPCWPVISDAPDKKLSMNMYTNPNGDYKLDTVLGERGIIRQVELELKGDMYTMTAADCFKKNKPWKINGKSEDPPADFRMISENRKGSEIVWHIFDQDTETSTELLCVRAVSNKRTGIPRINVQSISTSNDQAEGGSGFCSTGEIAEKKGEDSSAIHAGCVGEQTTALQACKNLVSWGIVDNQLEECAREYCLKADVNLEGCTGMLGNGKKNSNWVRQYCKALVNQGIMDSEAACHSQANQGWPYLLETYGNGYRNSDLQDSSECGSSWDDYLVEKKRNCSAGVNVETWDEDNQEWTVRFFIPADKPPCASDSLYTNAVETPILFTRKMRLTQCDVTSEEGCEALVATCGKVPGADFNLKFSNAISSLWDQKDVLRCTPRFDGDSPYWCLPWKDEMPDEEVCECPCQDDAGANAVNGTAALMNATSFP